MNLLTGFLKRIAKRVYLTPERLKAISALDPSHIYVENVRALFGISTGLAKRFCEFAVRQGVLERRVEVRCPDQSVAADASEINLLPPVVSCWEERDGIEVRVDYETNRLRKLEFYVLREEQAA